MIRNERENFVKNEKNKLNIPLLIITVVLAVLSVVSAIGVYKSANKDPETKQDNNAVLKIL